MKRLFLGAIVLGTLALPACRARETAVTVRFRAELGGAPVRCGETFVDASGRRVVLRDARLFVSEVAFTDRDGRRVPLALATAPPWQTSGVALLDFEDGCENGTVATRTIVEGTIPVGDWNALELVIGVPFALNHANPATAPPPLSAGSLHWSWRGGYKFAQVEATVDGEARRLHLGSTACQGAFHAVTGCNRPNHARVRLEDFDRDRSIVVFELAPLLAGDCQSEPEDACRVAFEALGLDLATGDAVAATGIASVGGGGRSSTSSTEATRGAEP